MMWEEQRLGNLLEIKHGFAFKSQFFSDAGEFILLTPGNCHPSGGLRLKGEREKFYVGDIPEDYVLDRGDIVVVMTDLVQDARILGGAFLIPESNRYLHNQRLGRVTIKSGARLRKEFLYYLLNSQSYRAQVRGSASGATVRHTSPTRIYNCRVRVPELHAQTRIAGVLSAYDNLIENNRRRIDLLERSAGLLFEEWFVRLRFPGHEHVAVVDGVPEGWESSTLGKYVVLRYGKALKEDDRVEGPYPVFGSSGIVGHHEQPFVAGPGIIVGRKGNAGTVFWAAHDFWPIDTVYYVDAETSSYYLYHALQHMGFTNNDGAVPGLNRNFAYSRRYVVPNERILSLFEEVATPLYQQIATLATMNDRLRQARDLLLPRLMSGEIVV